MPTAARRAEVPRHSIEAAERVTAGFRPSGVMDRYADETGPLVEPEWWADGCSDAPGEPLVARHSGDDRSRSADPTPSVSPTPSTRRRRSRPAPPGCGTA